MSTLDKTKFEGNCNLRAREFCSLPNNFFHRVQEIPFSSDFPPSADGKHPSLVIIKSTIYSEMPTSRAFYLCSHGTKFSSGCIGAKAGNEVETNISLNAHTVKLKISDKKSEKLHTCTFGHVSVIYERDLRCPAKRIQLGDLAAQAAITLGQGCPA